jgi:hypothetical protein
MNARSSWPKHTLNEWIMLKAIPNPKVHDSQRTDRRFIVTVNFGEHPFEFAAFSQMWEHFKRSGTTEWLHSQKWPGEAEAFKRSLDEVLRCVATAIPARRLGWGEKGLPRKSLTCRRQLTNKVSTRSPKSLLRGTIERVETDPVPASRRHSWLRPRWYQFFEARSFPMSVPDDVVGRERCKYVF